MQYKISGQRPERCKALCYKPRSTSSTTEIQMHCRKLKYKYYIIKGRAQDMKGQKLYDLQGKVRKCDLEICVSQEMETNPLHFFIPVFP
jgi:hypothetical protein